MKRKIKVMKIGRSFARHKGILWDKIYLVPEKDKDIIPKLFDYSIVMKKSKQMKEKLIESMMRHSPDSYYGNKDKVDVKYREHQIQRTDDPEKDFEKKILGGHDYIVIPILGKWDKRVKKLTPAYISNHKHRTKTSFANYWDKPEDFPSEAWLQTPGGEIKPVCAICKNSMESIAGKCKLGKFSCYDSLVFGSKSQFGMKHKEGAIQEEVDLKEDGKEVADV